jgi:hypothetical protein
LSSHVLSQKAKTGIYKTIILYGCETLCLILREKPRLMMFENRIMRKLFGLKKNERIGSWRELHNEELHYLYFSPSIIRMIKSKRIIWAGHVA